MSKQIILGIIGDLGAGKGLVTKYLEQTHGASTYKYSTILRDLLDRLHLAQSREHIVTISTAIRKHFGEDILSQVIATDVIKDQNKLVVIDGIRRPSDILHLQTLPGFCLVYVTADQQLRWQRIVARNENTGDDCKTFQEFLKDEESEADALIKETATLASHTIKNNGTESDCYKQVDLLLQHLT